MKTPVIQQPEPIEATTPQSRAGVESTPPPVPPVSETRLARSILARLLVLATPLVWAVLVLFHPMGSGTPYESIRDDLDRFLFLHVAQLFLTPLLAFTVWTLLAGLSSTAARVSRAALAVWMVFFSAYDAIQGIATGMLTRHANTLAGNEQSAVAGAIEYVVEDSRLGGNISALWVFGQGSWIVVALAAAMALHKAGAGKIVVAATCLSAVFAVHTAPAAAGLLALFVAVFLWERTRSRSAPMQRQATEA